MKPLIFLITLLSAQCCEAAWILWKHSVVTRNVEGVPRSITPQGAVDRWELINAVDARNECLTALRAEYKKVYANLAASYPKEPIRQSSQAEGISASMSAGAQTSSGASAKAMQLYYEYTFWCLPPGVDPRTTTMNIETK